MLESHVASAAKCRWACLLNEKLKILRACRSCIADDFPVLRVAHAVATLELLSYSSGKILSQKNSRAQKRLSCIVVILILISKPCMPGACLREAVELL